jgi:hypothetical protein
VLPIRGVPAHDAGSCDRGDGWRVCLASGNLRVISRRFLVAAR